MDMLLDTRVFVMIINDQYSGKFDNSVGETLEMKRRSVDDDPNNGCSYGFHVGSFDYADSWAGADGRLMVVRFDPKDAVSVPSCSSYQKVASMQIRSDCGNYRWSQGMG